MNLLEKIDQRANLNENHEDIITTLSKGLVLNESSTNSIDVGQNTISSNSNQLCEENNIDNRNMKTTGGQVNDETSVDETIAANTNHDKETNRTTLNNDTQLIDAEMNKTTDKNTLKNDNETNTNDRNLSGKFTSTRIENETHELEEEANSNILLENNNGDGETDDEDEDVLNLFDEEDYFSDVCDELTSALGKLKKKTEQSVGTTTKPPAMPQTVNNDRIIKITSEQSNEQGQTEKSSKRFLPNQSNKMLQIKKTIHLDTVPPLSKRKPSNRGRRCDPYVAPPPLPALMNIHVDPIVYSEQPVIESAATIQLRRTIQRRLSVSADLMANQNAAPDEPIPIPYSHVQTSLKLPSFYTDPYNEMTGFEILFPDICRRYLNNKCIKCEYSHVMPDPDIIADKLNRMSREKVYTFYNVFMLRNQKLFNKYFPQFCAYFAMNNLMEYLVQMVNDCAHQMRRASGFFMNIIEGFQRTGLTPENALRKLIDSLEKPTLQTKDKIVRLIMEESNNMIISLLDVLQKFTENDGFIFEARHVNKLIKMYLDAPKTELGLLLYGILAKPDSNVDKSLLAAFMAKSVELFSQ